MKRRHMVLFAALLMIAACFGWLLPAAVFHVEDRMEEEKRETMQIKQFDLTYQSDLDTAARLALVARSAPRASVTPLDRGIYLGKQDVEGICELFLRDLTGVQYAIENRCEMTPTLLEFEGEGTIVAWIVTVYLNEAWRWEATIDDQTGLILHCSFYGADPLWENLFLNVGREKDRMTFLLSHISEAMRDHYASRLSEEFTCEVNRKIESDLYCEAEITFRKANEPEFSIPIMISSEDHENHIISIN